jgi:hypothetical protein
MKGYAVFLCCVACLLMLLPLPARPKAPPAAKPPLSAPTESEPPADTPQTDEPTFKVLTDGKVTDFEAAVVFRVLHKGETTPVPGTLYDYIPMEQWKLEK